MAFTNFFSESISYINPKGFKGWFKFFISLPRTYYRYSIIVIGAKYLHIRNTKIKPCINILFRNNYDDAIYINEQVHKQNQELLLSLKKFEDNITNIKGVVGDNFIDLSEFGSLYVHSVVW